MDPISRESSPSYLPIAGLVIGLVGLLLGGIALANASKANSAATAAKAALDEQIARIDSAESAASGANSAAERAGSNFGVLKSSTQEGFNVISAELAKLNGEVAKLQEAATRSATASTAKSATGSTTKAASGSTAKAGPAVAGPGEYVVKSGDTGMKIAQANGFSIGDLQAVNPGVNWKALKVGQKLKLPKK